MLPRRSHLPFRQRVYFACVAVALLWVSVFRGTRFDLLAALVSVSDRLRGAEVSVDVLGLAFAFAVTLAGVAVPLYLLDMLFRVRSVHRPSMAGEGTSFSFVETVERPALDRTVPVSSGGEASSAPAVSSGAEGGLGPGKITTVLDLDAKLDLVEEHLRGGRVQEALFGAHEVHRLDRSTGLRIARAITARAVDYYRAGRWDEALNLFESSLEFDENDGDAHLYCARCHVRYGSFDLARDAYLRVIQIDAANFPAYLELGQCYARLGHSIEAFKALGIAAENGRMPEAHLSLARMSEEAGDLNTAVQHYEACLSLAPDDDRGRVARERLTALSAAVRS